MKTHFTHERVVTMLVVMHLLPKRLRPLILLAFASAAGDAAIVPLVPLIRRDLGLSGAEVGALFAATTLAVLLAAIPAGQLAARHGARPLLLGSALLGPAALAGMALAPDLPTLLAARFAFGLAFAVFWSVGAAVAATRAPGARGSGAVIAASGLGWLAGPLLAGGLGDAAGWRVPLFALAVLTAPVALGLVRDASDAAYTRPVRLRSTLALVRRVPAAASATATAALLGVVTGTIGVLVPTVLARNGISATGIGLAVAAASVVWIASGGLAARLSGARIDVRVAATVVAALAVCWSVPVASLSSLAILGFLVLAAACRALLGAIIYPLAARAADGESEATSLSGVFNLAWALPALVSPLVAGAAVEHGVVRAAFGAVCLLAALLAVGMLLVARHPAGPHPATG